MWTFCGLLFNWTHIWCPLLLCWVLKYRISRWDLLNIKSTLEKVIAKCGFGNRLHDLKYFEVGFFFLIFLVFVIT